MEKNKRNRMIAIFGTVIILVLSVLAFNQIYTNHQENNRIIDECFENFGENGEVVLKKEGFWSPVVCEKN